MKAKMIITVIEEIDVELDDKYTVLINDWDDDLENECLGDCYKIMRKLGYGDAEFNALETEDGEIIFEI